MTSEAEASNGVEPIAVPDAASDDGGVRDSLPETWSDSLVREFALLAGALLTGSTVAEVLRGIVAASSTLVPAADLVSITLRDSAGRFTTPVRTDALAVQLDELQYTHTEGPCVDATLTPGPGIVNVTDLTATTPWQQWAPAAAELGVRSVLAVGLTPSGRSARLGALNFYAYQPDTLGGLDQDMVIVLASHAAVALAATTAITAAELEAAQLRKALATRDVIGQAKGILMQRRGVTADEAFDILRRASQHLNIKLAEVAVLVTNRRADLLAP